MAISVGERLLARPPRAAHFSVASARRALELQQQKERRIEKRHEQRLLMRGWTPPGEKPMVPAVQLALVEPAEPEGLVWDRIRQLMLSLKELVAAFEEALGEDTERAFRWAIQIGKHLDRWSAQMWTRGIELTGCDIHIWSDGVPVPTDEDYVPAAEGEADIEIE